MTKYLLTTSVAALALGLAPPSFAGDDSATIIQTNGSGNLATQHQPGGTLGNVAYINQNGDTGSTATQEQWRNLPGGVDFAIGSQQTINQSGNGYSRASQEDNGNGGDVQNATQTNNVYYAGPTSVSQTINSPYGYNNKQGSTQSYNYGSSVDQNIGGSAPGSYTLHDNAQTASQSYQVDSSIGQTIGGTSSGNKQTASETSSYGYGYGNSISQTILASTGDQQNAAIGGAGSSHNSITQNQQTGSSNDKQTASITTGSYNTIDQLQAAGSYTNTQTVGVNGSSGGRAFQFQGAGVTGNSETISQTLGGTGNQAGQAQGNSNNIASITQSGGSGNMAVQNQGINSGTTGFMFISGGTVHRQ